MKIYEFRLKFWLMAAAGVGRGWGGVWVLTMWRLLHTLRHFDPLFWAPEICFWPLYLSKNEENVPLWPLFWGKMYSFAIQCDRTVKRKYKQMYFLSIYLLFSLKIVTQDNSSAKGWFTWGSVTYNNDNILTNLPMDKMAAISQTTFPDAFSWMNGFVFWMKFHWSLFLRLQLTIIQPWVKVMAWRRICDKSLSQPMLTSFTDEYMRPLGKMS